MTRRRGLDLGLQGWGYRGGVGGAACTPRHAALGACSLQAAWGGAGRHAEDRGCAAGLVPCASVAARRRRPGVASSVKPTAAVAAAAAVPVGPASEIEGGGNFGRVGLGATGGVSFPQAAAAAAAAAMDGGSGGGSIKLGAAADGGPAPGVQGAGRAWEDGAEQVAKRARALWAAAAHGARCSCFAASRQRGRISGTG